MKRKMLTHIPHHFAIVHTVHIIASKRGQRKEKFSFHLYETTILKKQLSINRTSVFQHVINSHLYIKFCLEEKI